MLEKMNVGPEEITEIINRLKETGISDTELMAARYFEQFLDEVRGWMPEPNYINVWMEARQLKGSE